jgi:hypothetical protein
MSEEQLITFADDVLTTVLSYWLLSVLFWYVRLVDNDRDAATI